MPLAPLMQATRTGGLAAAAVEGQSTSPGFAHSTAQAAGVSARGAAAGAWTRLPGGAVAHMQPHACVKQPPAATQMRAPMTIALCQVVALSYPNDCV